MAQRLLVVDDEETAMWWKKEGLQLMPKALYIIRNEVDRPIGIKDNRSLLFLSDSIGLTKVVPVQLEEPDLGFQLSKMPFSYTEGIFLSVILHMVVFVLR